MGPGGEWMGCGIPESASQMAPLKAASQCRTTMCHMCVLLLLLLAAGYEDEAEFEDALNGPFSDFLKV